MSHLLKMGILFVTLSFVACTNAQWTGQPQSSLSSPLVITSPIMPKIVKPAADFGFRFTYGMCSTNVLDTFTGTYSKDLVNVASPIISLRLTSAELTDVYTKMYDINLFGYPTHYSVLNSLAITESIEITSREPSMSYGFMVQNAGITHNVQWHDSIIQPTAPEADRLRELAQFVIDIIEQRPEIQQLPELQVGCL